MNNPCPNCNYPGRRGWRCEVCGAIGGWYPFELVALTIMFITVSVPSFGCMSLVGVVAYDEIQKTIATATAQANQTATSVRGTEVAYQQATVTKEMQIANTATTKAMLTGTAEKQAEETTTAEAEAIATAKKQTQETATALAQATATAEKKIEQTATAEVQATATTEKQAEQTATAEFQATATAEVRATATARIQATATQRARRTATAQARATSTANARNTGIVVEVRSDRGWQDSGFYVSKGETVNISYISGKWTIWAGGQEYTDARGHSIRQGVIDNFRHGALIAKVADGKAIEILNGKNFTADRSGNVHLSINDVITRDNDGEIKVRVQIGGSQSVSNKDGTDYIIQSGDTLSKLAERYYDDLSAYPAIIYHTNLKQKKDSSYAKLDNSGSLEIGWKIYIPNLAEVEEYMADYVPPEKPTDATIFTVDGKKKWQDSGVHLKTGDSVIVTYRSGKWSIDPKNHDYTDAEGLTSGSHSGKGILLAKVGNGSSREMGNQRQFYVRQNGTLYLKMKDSECCYGDNDGKIEVKIEVKPGVSAPAPFRGDFTFGRSGVQGDCTVAEQIDRISRSKMTSVATMESTEEGIYEWYYFATSFQRANLGQYISWFVYDADGDVWYDGERELELDDDGDTCLWQGFALYDWMSLGEYRLVIFSEETQVYEKKFRLVE